MNTPNMTARAIPTALSACLALLALAAALGSPTPQLGGVGGPTAGMRYVPDADIRMLGAQRPKILLDKDGRHWLRCFLTSISVALPLSPAAPSRRGAAFGGA